MDLAFVASMFYKIASKENLIMFEHYKIPEHIHFHFSQNLHEVYTNAPFYFITQ
jgi:hypothetical protein